MVLTIKCVKVLPEFNFVCFKCQLKTGALSVGRIGLVLALIHSIEAFYTLGMQVDELDAKAKQVLMVRLISGLVELFLNVMLVYGAWKDKTEMMLPWIMINYVGLIIAALLVIIYIIISLTLNLVGFAILILIFGTLIVCFFGYMWLGVYSYYRQICDGNGQLDYGGDKPKTEETILYAGEAQKVYNEPQAIQPEAV